MPQTLQTPGNQAAPSQVPEPTPAPPPGDTAPLSGLKERWKEKAFRRRVLRIGAVILVLLLVLVGQIRKARREQTESTEPVVQTITVSTLESFIATDELSTFTTVYQGVAVVYNEKKEENVDYYVAYDATVYAGLDFSKVTFVVDDSTKTIDVLLPEAHITDTNIAITSLDYMFYNKKADQSSVSEEAYKACLTDLDKEITGQTAILTLARQNATNVLRALLEPMVEQLDETYVLNFK